MGSSFPLFLLILNMTKINPVYTFTDLNNLDIFSILNKDFKNVSGIYAFQLIETNEIVYIGSTIDLARRFWQHQSNNGSNIILQRAIKKYGIEAFIQIFELFLNCIFLT